MKNEDKKVPDAPKRLWVRTNSLIHDSGLMAVGNISFREYWVVKPKRWYRTPIEAYKMLSCKLHLHWGSNPLVFVYDFQLIK